MQQRCIACGQIQGAQLECIACGAKALEKCPPKAQQNRAVKWTEATRELVKTRSPLFEATGGVVPTTGVVILSGPAGAGKSTLAAEFVLEMQRDGMRPAHALDAEMSDALANSTWRRAGGRPRELNRLERKTPEDGTWREIVKGIEGGVVLVDSLHEWQRLDRQVVDDCNRRSELATRALVVVIAHYAKAGRVYGDVTAEFRADAVIIVERERITVQKCTWAAAGGVSLRRAKA